MKITGQLSDDCLTLEWRLSDDCIKKSKNIPNYSHRTKQSFGKTLKYGFCLEIVVSFSSSAYRNVA